MASETPNEFFFVSINSIVVWSQVRSVIDTAGESFLGLVESIRLYGILEPLIVMPLGDGTYRLICGERRFLAAQAAGLTEVPVAFIPEGTPEAEITALQLTENMQRMDLNCIDLAEGVLKYLHIKHADSNQGLPYALGVLTRFSIAPNDLANTVRETISQICKITGKSARTLFNMLSLLRLNSTIQEALRKEALLVSQGYLFAANLDCPDLMRIFESIMATPVTNATLEKMLTAHRKVKPATPTAPALTLSKQHKSIAAMTKTIDKYMDRWDKDDLQKLINELRTLADRAEAHLAGATA